MENYDRYSKLIIKSVNYIFKNFLFDNSIKEIYESETTENDPRISIEIDGRIEGEIIINFPTKTLNQITKHFYQKSSQKTLKIVEK